MQLSLRGWSRDHGSTTLVSKILAPDNVRSVPEPIGQDEVLVSPVTKYNRAGDAQTNVVVNFGLKNVRLGGDYFGTLELSVRDIELMFYMAHKNTNLAKFAKIMDYFASIELKATEED